MKKKEKNVMVPVGTKGDYEVFQVVPMAVNDASQLEAEITTHYKQNADALLTYGSNDDVEYDQITVGSRKFTYAKFGDDDQAPYNCQQLTEQNMVMSQCQQFNILTLYGQGIRFIDRRTKAVSEDPEIRRFCLQNAIHRVWLRMSSDMEFHFFSVMVIYLSRDHSRIVNIRMAHACDCRFVERDEYGCIPYVLIGNFRQGTGIAERHIEAVPLLDEINPLGDLLYRVKGQPHMYSSVRGVPPADGEHCKFALLCMMPTPGSQYYPIPYYTSIWRDAWYDIYRLIGIGKRYMIKNTAAPRIQVEVHRSYWNNVCQEEGITDPKLMLKRKLKERDNITDFCTKPENAGKAWVTTYDTMPDGKERRMVRIYNLIEGSKKEGGDWSDDMQEASNSLCFAMGVHPNMVGAVPGKSQMNNSGSDKRELFTLKQALQKAFRDIMEVPFHVIMYYNSWEERFALDVPMIQLTTLDKGVDAEEKSVNIDDNDSNKSDGK